MNGRLMKIWDEYPELLLRVKMYTSMLDQLQKEDFAEELDRVRNDPIMSAEIKAKLVQSIMQRQQMRGFDREMYKKLLQQDGTELAMFESALDALPESLREVAKALALGEESWDLIAERHYISRTTLAHYRKRALAMLSAVYDRHDRAEIEELLS